MVPGTSEKQVTTATHGIPSHLGGAMAFAHLHTHTEHSFLDGLSRIPDLVQRVADDLGQSAVAITDHGQVSGHLELQRACDEHGIKPIFGIEGYFCPDRFERKGHKGQFYEHMVLLAISQKGLENLWRLSSLAWMEGSYRDDPRFDWELLEEYNEGLIGTSGCLSGCVTKFLVKGDDKENRRYNPDTAQQRLSRFLEIFGNRFYMELHTFGDQIQKDTNNEVVALASTLGVPTIAVSDAHYLRPEQWRAHEILTAMQMGKTADDPSRYQYGPEQLCVMGEEWVRERLSYLGESVVEEAVSNTAKIAEMAEGRIEGDDTKPVYFEDTQTDLMKLWDLALDGAERKLPKIKEDRPLSIYTERLEKELGVVGDKGFAGYFLLVADIVKWCKENGILTGPARGSAGGSLLAYVLDITEMDPIKHGLLFERFLDPERATIPDIDVDVPQALRGRVKEYLQSKYGENSIATIGTLAREKPKGLMDDLGRTLEIPYSHVEEIKKIIDSVPDLEVAHIDTPWDHILGEVESEMKPWMEKYPLAFELMDEYNGIIRHASGHAAGVVVSKESLLGRLPLRTTKDDVRTQVEAEDVEFLGYVKFDLLGLRTLDTLDQAMKMARDRHPDDEIADYNDWHKEFDKYYGDLDVYKSTWGGKTIGVFQLETPGFRQHIKWFKPKDMEDLAALISINRPGNTRAEDPTTGLKLIDLYREKREGLREATYKHPKLREVLERTNGNFLYQEQIMEACVVLAGYSLSETDRVRKILGKKLVDKMEQEREIFVTGCYEHSGIEEDLANAIFDEMEAFAKYGFNKSHAMGYAFLAFWCMYMKYHYPREFMTALFCTNEGASAIYQRETSRMGIQVLGPDVNEAEAGFTLTPGGIIRYGLSKIKWLGKGADHVVREREENGPFDSVADFVERVSEVNKRGAEGLIGVGAMDSLLSDAKHYPEWFTRQMKVLHEYWEARGDFHTSTPTVPKKLNKTTIRELAEDYDGEPDFDIDGPCLFGYPEVAEKIGADPAHCLNHTNFEHYCEDIEVADFAEMERKYLDALVTVDPLKEYMGLISQEDDYPGEGEMLVGEVARLGGLISEVKETVTKKGRNPGSDMCHIWVELPMHTGSEEGDNEEEWAYTEDRVQVVVFPDSYSKFKEDIEQGAPVLCDVSKLAPKNGYRGGLCLQNMYRLDRI